MIISTTEVQNNFGKYLKLAAEGEEILITSHGRIVATLISYKEYNAHFEIREGVSEYVHSGMKVSYEEFLEIAENSQNRYEYIDGEIFLLATPRYDHQKAAREIFREFASWFKGKPCEPLMAPFDVTLHKEENDSHVVQPDILVLCDKQNINKDGQYFGTPTLLVEVVSKASSSMDFIKKLNLYMLSGVKEYWIVNPSSRSVNVFTFADKQIAGMSSFNDFEKVESVVFPGLSVELRNIFY